MLPSMLRTGLRITSLTLCLIAIAATAQAQTRKPGLWEVTTTMTFQQPTGAGGAPRTTQVCVTQEQLDKYGAITPQSAGCHFTNVVKNLTGTTADMVCSGKMDGKGALESSWADADHTTTKVHFTGTMPLGAVEWTSTSSYVYKSPDCGSVKPVDEPAAH
ncbi:DUF3617 domain-containing protein [Edaphobacter bradus]|uniref:DUF3617 domain-containing protein n=1 Tax=Edaphobacter bradus TaxID=2259016 RepID=UPI0021DFF996|nr:DUF3617 domain-containing protein [Edaphobacter bradus]